MWSCEWPFIVQCPVNFEIKQSTWSSDAAAAGSLFKHRLQFCQLHVLNQSQVVVGSGVVRTVSKMCQGFMQLNFPFKVKKKGKREKKERSERRQGWMERVRSQAYLQCCNHT